MLENKNMKNPYAKSLDGLKLNDPVSAFFNFSYNNPIFIYVIKGQLIDSVLIIKIDLLFLFGFLTF